MRGRPRTECDTMRAILLGAAVLLGTAVAIGAAFDATAGEGQGPGDTSKSTIGQLQLGDYWYGKRIAKADLEGKVVLFEIWGS